MSHNDIKTSLNINIADTGNQAISDNPIHEVVAALRTIIQKLEAGNEDGVIYDSNGIKVGEWHFETCL